MKHLHNLLTLAAMACLTFGMTACNDDNNDPETTDLIYNFGLQTNVYDANGYWTEALNPEQGAIEYTGVKASHSVSVTEWNGNKYYSWLGFCPSKASDLKDYTADGTWTDHQWNAIPGKGYSTPNYLVGYWDVTEKIDKDIINPSCYLKFDSEVSLVSMMVANTTWSYFAMKNGTAFNRKFGTNDKCILLIYGRLNGVTTNGIQVTLAADGNIDESWIGVDLTGLGVVDELVFQMDSTDKGEYGMNNPAYFCITDMYTQFYKSPIK